MICGIERDKGLGVSRGHENARRAVDGDGKRIGWRGGEEDGRSVVDGDVVVARAMKYEQGLMQSGYSVRRILPRDVVEKLLFNAKGTTAQRHPRLTLPFDFRRGCCKQP